MKTPTQKWFRAKNYGWGWTPNTWQGWLVLGIWFVLFLCVTLAPEILMPDSLAAVVWASGAGLVLTGILLVITYRTGEPPAWRWGNRSNTK